MVCLVMRRGVVLTAAGLLLGARGALSLSRSLESFLFGITATDTSTFVAVSLLLGAVAALACYIPVSRAAGASPVDVLRAD